MPAHHLARQGDAVRLGRHGQLDVRVARGSSRGGSVATSVASSPSISIRRPCRWRFPARRPPKRPWSPRGPAHSARAGSGSPALSRRRLERAPDQARDVHLGDADALGDLGLGEALLEAQVEDDALAGRQVGQAGVEGRPGLGGARSPSSSTPTEMPTSSSPSPPPAGERRGALGAAGRQGVEHVVERQAGRPRRSRAPRGCGRSRPRRRRPRGRSARAPPGCRAGRGRSRSGRGSGGGSRPGSSASRSWRA